MPKYETSLPAPSSTPAAKAAAAKGHPFSALADDAYCAGWLTFA